MAWKDDEDFARLHKALIEDDQATGIEAGFEIAHRLLTALERIAAALEKRPG